MSYSTYQANALLAANMTTRYVALYTVAPTAGGGGTEVSGGSYARVSAPFTITGNVAANTSTITFPTPTGSWGTVVAVGLLDASTAGNLKEFGNLTVNRTIGTGTDVTIAAGALTFTLT